MSTPSEPVFVYGALRSGTTLLRIMLRSHPQIANPGEADFLFDFLSTDTSHPTGWRYDLTGLAAHRIFQASGLELPADLDGLDLLHAFLDQYRAMTPGQQLTINLHRHAKKAQAALPHARFIHLIRDPRDVAYSSIGMGWNGNSYHGVAHWIWTERNWDAAALPPHHIIELNFEALMADVEGQLTRLCDFMGLPFSANMLRYYEGTTYGPPEPSTASRWQRTAPPREIALIEGRCGDLLTARGYVQNGPPAYPGKIRLFCLNQDNRLRRWLFNIRKYGLPLFVMGHVTRIPGLGIMRRQIRARQLEVDIRSLQ